MTSMPNDWLAPLYYMALGALLFFAAQQLARLGHKPTPRRRGGQARPERRLDFDAEMVDHLDDPLPQSDFDPGRFWVWDNLTRREMKVARLVAQGKQNAQVAQELQISPFTVETHLKHIYLKLKVTSRTELAHVIQELVD